MTGGGKTGGTGLLQLVGAVDGEPSGERHTGPAPRVGSAIVRSRSYRRACGENPEQPEGSAWRHQTTARRGEAAAFLQPQRPRWLPALPQPVPASHPPPGAGRGGSPWPPTPLTGCAPRGRCRRGSIQCHRMTPTGRRRRRRRRLAGRVGRKGGASGSCVTQHVGGRG